MAKVTKQKMVEDYLIKNGSISSLEAINNFWATRLSAIIFTLKKEGWQFDTQMEKHPTGSHYARYRILNLPVGYSQNP